MNDITERIKRAEIRQKANNCVGCKIKPCQYGCPLNNDITGVIALVKEGKIEEAYRLLSQTTLMPAICGKICPQGKQCQGMCVKGVAYNSVEIGDIEAYIGDEAIKNDWKILNGPAQKINKKVAVVGGGPAGLTCAGFLAKRGVDVTIYEKYDYLGGLLMHGIPSFRLDKDYLQKAISKILELGINVKLNQELGRDFTLEELEKNYDAIYLSFGANISAGMNIPGEELKGVLGGVLGGNEMLEEGTNIDFRDKVVVVSGGGNVAMDVSRTAQRGGAKRVIIVYRRGENEMPAERKEIALAKEEGVEFLFNTKIIAIKGDEKVEKIECVKTKLICEEGSRPQPVDIEGSNFFIDIDYIIMAVGSVAEEKVVKQLGLALDKKNKIIIDENCRTSNEKVFAGGDLSNFKKTGSVAWASRSGRDASEAIFNYLLNK